MNQTPQANRLTVAIYGRCNAGKSSLFNAFTGAENAIVSHRPGTTTDPVVKSMELLPHGPIVLIDTAGLGDEGELGGARVKRTASILERTDFALYAMDATDPKEEEYRQFAGEFQRRNIPHLLLLTKRDQASPEALDALGQAFPASLPVSAEDAGEVEALRGRLSQELDKLAEAERSLLRGLLPEGGCVVMVVPIDSEAPKGRLILPQVQLIRECLDCGLRCHVTTEVQLPQALAELGRVDLVVTDSQAFGVVDGMVPREIPLTSFSILMARQKGDIATLRRGTLAAEGLEEGARVLIAETCTHTHSHEDIGRVKLPALLQKKLGKELRFDFAAGRDYPEGLEQYGLIVHCGGCMITRREMCGRMRMAEEKGVPITNYGLVLAWGTGILERSLEILGEELK